MVFVPAIMGAGLVFSVVTLLQDVLAQGSQTMQARRARIRGAMVAASVIDPDSDDLIEAADLEQRSTFVLAALVSAVFGTYVLIGASGNFFQRGRYISNIAWIWGGSVAIALGAFFLAATCLVVVLRYRHPPPWVWDVLIPTPLVGAHDAPHAARTRWILTASLAVTTALTVMATTPRVLAPFDRALVAFVDESGLEGIDRLGHLVGSTRASLLAAVVVGVSTLRCRRFAWLFIASVVISLAATQFIRMLVKRPRPLDGPLAGAVDSFPSGHLVQATLLATLVPLAVYELTRIEWASRAATAGLAAAILLVAIERIAHAHHEPTDIIAGITLGLAVGAWTRLALIVPGSHSQCRECAFRAVTREPTEVDEHVIGS